MDGSELKNDQHPADGTNGIVYTIKCSLLRWAVVGADKVMMDRKAWRMRSSVVDIDDYVSTLERHPNGPGGVRMEWGPGSRASHAPSMRRYGFGRKGGRTNREKVDEANDRYADWISDPTDVSRASMINPQPSKFLSIFATFLSRSIGFQFGLFVSFLAFPIRASYFSIMFLMFPFHNLARLRRYFLRKLIGTLGASSRTIAEKAQTSIRTATVMLGCALFWSSYVCALLFGLLVSSLVLGGLMMRLIVEKPFQAIEDLNFDYTKSSPVAFVPIMDNSTEFEPGKAAGSRVIPYGHNLQVSVSLKMPESEYNRKLGVFQVRVEFLSASGRVTATSSRSYMLRFKSQPVRFAQSIIRSIPLLAGLQSETQILNIRMGEFREGVEPTAAFRVVLEQRAEYKDGVGAPEVYEASISVESELPPVKRTMWQWRRTVYVWTSIVMFFSELLFVLIFFRWIVLPRGRGRRSQMYK